MIELGSVTIRDQDSIAEVRSKVLGLVLALRGGEVLATRAATAISELARSCLLAGASAPIAISLAEDGPAMRLHLRISGAGAVDPAPLRPFLDRVAGPGPGGDITAELPLPISPHQVDPALIRRERLRIASKSRTELMDELRKTNRRLEEYNETLESTVAQRTEQLRDANSRMQRDLDAGAAYVRGIIPPPATSPIAIGWRYIPSSNLGGDTIGYHWIDPDHLALYLIDVTGHGLDSALLAVTITSVIRSGSLAGADMKRPDQVVGALNTAFQAEHHGLKYFTIWYGVYEPNQRRLTWSGGGHHPSVLLRAGAEPVLLEASGPIMGCAPDMEYPAESCDVAPGSRFLLFSDGVFEILRDDRVVWTFSALMQHLRGLPAGDGFIMDELLAHVQSLRGGPHLDDDFSIIEAKFD
jgi:serine phosphatase RsbU (regulator of sigma subunit)